MAAAMESGICHVIERLRESVLSDVVADKQQLALSVRDWQIVAHQFACPAPEVYGATPAVRDAMTGQVSEQS